MAADKELSTLQNVDIHFGKWLSEAFSPLRTTAGPVQFQDFLKRPVNRQIYRTIHNAPIAFLKSLEGGGNPVELPICFYSRTPGINAGEERYLTDPVTKANAEAVVKFATMPVNLLYSVFFLSWDTLSLDEMQLAFYAHRQANMRFQHYCQIGLGEGVKLTGIDARIVNHKECTFSDMSADLSAETRVYCVQTDVEVNTQAVIGSAVTLVSPIRIELRWVGFSCGGKDARFEPLPEPEPVPETP